MVAKLVAKSDAELLNAIAPDVERLYNRHLEAPRLWFPHEQIDWGSGENFNDKAWISSIQENLGSQYLDVNDCNKTKCIANRNAMNLLVTEGKKQTKIWMTS